LVAKNENRSGGRSKEHLNAGKLMLEWARREQILE
jgi:hypothetical protein